MDLLFSSEVPIIGAIAQTLRFKSPCTFQFILVLQNKSGPAERAF